MDNFHFFQKIQKQKKDRFKKFYYIVINDGND